MQKFIKYTPFLLFTILYLCIFYKVFLQGLLPFPSDLLVSFFFPYNSGGWEGFTSWTTRKEFISADVIRQIFPWHILATDIFKDWAVPLWNPYSFSGTPLLANLQTAAFYPVNILFFIFSPKIAWTMYVLLQPIMAFAFMYLFIRSLNLSRFSALLAGLAFGFIGYFRIWFELGVVGHSGLWLPLILFGITKYFQTSNFRYIILSAFGVACSLLGGHIQTAAYVLLVSVAYVFAYLIKNHKTKKRKYFLLSFLFIFLGFGLAAIQILPTLELLQNSARGDISSTALFHKFQLPAHHLLTLFVPEFFGNPATGNFWGTDYAEFMAYAGIITIAFAFIAVFEKFKEFHVRFALVLILLSLLLAMSTPFSELLILFNIPVLNTGFPSRILFIVQFAIVLLSAYGLDAFVKSKRLKLSPFIILGGIYFILIAFVFTAPYLFQNAPFLQYLPIAKRNIVIPIFLVGLACTLLFIGNKFVKVKPLVIVIILFLAAFDYQYVHYKYLPFAPQNYIFPQHPLITFLQQKSPPDRVYGYGTARLETNLSTHWRILSPEGYDPLYIRRYGELVYATRDGYTTNIMRADAQFKESEPKNDSYSKQVLMNIVGVKYLIDKDDTARKETNGESNIFQRERYNLTWQLEKWKVYENKQAIPRAHVFYDWTVKNNNKEIIDTLFNPNFDYRNKLVIERPITIKPTTTATTSAAIVSYKPNSVTIKAKTARDGLLFLSDNYYPGWNAYVDGQKTEILRADYSFRAVPLTTGDHTVIFKYEPLSFMVGAIITFSSILLSALLILFVSRKTKKER